SKNIVSNTAWTGSLRAFRIRVTRLNTLRVEDEQSLSIRQYLRRIPTCRNETKLLICISVKDRYRVSISQRHKKAIPINHAGSWRDAKAASLLCHRDRRSDSIGLRVDYR